MDNGPWHQARLLDTRQRHSWQWWELIVVLDGSGPRTIRARATDLAGRTQPDDPEWNRLGTAATQFSKCASIAPRLDELAQGRATA